MENVPNQWAEMLLRSFLIKVIKMYTRGNFVMGLILMDQEFDKLERIRIFLMDGKCSQKYNDCAHACGGNGVEYLHH